MAYGFTDEELAELSKWMLYYVIELKKDKKGFDKKQINSYLKQHNIILIVVERLATKLNTILLNFQTPNLQYVFPS